MTVFMIILLICVLIALVILIVEVRNQSTSREEKTLDLLLKNQEVSTQQEANEKQLQFQFQSLQNQIQMLRKEQTTSYQTMDALNDHMDKMTRIMTNTKARGTWGEYQLEYLLKMYVGNNTEVYSLQYTLPNGKIADAILHLPDTKKVLCIDSKFPMENYVAGMEKQFVQNVKKHINDVADKYINMHTVNEAILFLPSEGVYQEICAGQSDILEYALSRHVLLTSPTTLVGVIYALLASTKDFYQATHMDEIEKEILKLEEDMNRLVERIEKAQRSYEALGTHLENASTSVHKLDAQMQKIKQG